MGVLACDRSNCDSIMCDRLINDSQYICDSCYEELMRKKVDWPTSLTKMQLQNLIQGFMETVPGSFSVVDIDEALSEIITPRTPKES